MKKLICVLLSLALVCPVNAAQLFGPTEASDAQVTAGTSGTTYISPRRASAAGGFGGGGGGSFFKNLLVTGQTTITANATGNLTVSSANANLTISTNNTTKTITLDVSAGGNVTAANDFASDEAIIVSNGIGKGVKRGSEFATINTATGNMAVGGVLAVTGNLSANRLTLNAGSALLTTNQTGTGNIVLQSDPIVLTPNAAMGALAIDVTKRVNTKTLTGTTATFTFSATPTAGTTFGIKLTGHTSDCVVTMPASCYSLARNATLTTFNMPANAVAEISIRYDGTTYFVVGEPTNLTITEPAAATTVTIASGGSFITAGAYAATLTFTGTTGVTFPTSGTLATTTTLPPLTSTRIGYGDGSNLLTGEAAFTYNATNNTATIGAVSLGAGSEVSTIGPLVDVVDGTTPLNNINQTVAAGTAYTLTTSYASVDFGTTDPILTIANAGTYAIYVNVQTSLAATTSTTQTVSFKLRRTNNTAADLTGSTFGLHLPAATVETGLGPSISIGPIKYTTALTTDTITVQGILSAALGAGTVTASDCTITAIRMY